MREMRARGVGAEMTRCVVMKAYLVRYRAHAKLELPRGDGGEQDHPEGEDRRRLGARGGHHVRIARLLALQIERQQTAQASLRLTHLLEERRVEVLARLDDARARR